MAVVQGIQLDPLIAEARRRARRRRLALLAVALAGAGGGIAAWRLTTGTPAPPSPAADAARIAAVARRTNILELGLSGGVGWAMNGLGFWITRDGGGTWITATPKHVRTAGDAYARIDDVRFVDRDHGWLSAADVYGGFPLPKNAPTWRHMEIDRTTDGGRTWHASIPPGCFQLCGETHLSFVDARRGFAIVAQGVFATTDGGATWSRVARPPFSGEIAFVGARRGFGVSDPARWGGPQEAVPIGGGRVYRTVDGGRSWVRLPLGGNADSVTFFGRDGVVPVRVRTTRGQRLVVHVTHDGGASWTTRTAPFRLDRQWGVPAGSSYFSAASPGVWVVAGSRVLHETTDAGRSWHTVRPLGLPARATIWQASFTSASDGWAIFWLPKGNGGSGALVRTTDGGLTWTPLAPPVPKLPPLPKPVGACGSSCRTP